MIERLLDPSLIDRLEPPRRANDMDPEGTTLALRVAVEGLPPELRDTVELYYWGRYRPVDIARMLGCRRQTVYNRLQRATTLLAGPVSS